MDLADVFGFYNNPGLGVPYQISTGLGLREHEVIVTNSESVFLQWKHHIPNETGLMARIEWPDATEEVALYEIRGAYLPLGIESNTWYVTPYLGIRADPGEIVLATLYQNDVFVADVTAEVLGFDSEDRPEERCHEFDEAEEACGVLDELVDALP